MYKSVPIEMLRVLTKNELKELHNFVLSPFYNKNKNVVKLYNIIKKYYPEFESPGLEKKKIYMKIFPGKNYNDNTMRSLIFELSSLVHQYLAVNYLRKNKLDARRYAALEFLERGADTLFLREYNKAENLLKETPKDKIPYLNAFLISHLAYAYYGERHILNEKEDIIGYSDILINFFLYNIMDINSYIINKKNIINFKYKGKLLNEILNYVESNDFEHEPLILLKYYFLKLSLDNSNTEFYYKIKDVLKADSPKITHRDKYNACVLLQNVSVQNYQTGRPEFKKELMEIYEMMLSKEIYAGDKSEFMSHQLYKNIILIMLELNKPDRAEKFINEYKDKLSSIYKENSYYYALAKLAFTRKQYDECLRLSAKVAYDDVLNKMEVKVLAVKTHYELGNYETVLYNLDSFRHFTNNKLMTDHFAEMCINFVKSVNHLVKLKESSGDRNAVNDFIYEVKSEKTILSREWLLNKADEILAKNTI